MDTSRRKPTAHRPRKSRSARSATDPFIHPKDDAALSRALGEDGMERVTEHSAAEWSPHAQQVVLRVCDLYPGRLATGEQISNAVRHYYCEPAKPQAWGALTNWALRQGLIELTGDRRPMARPSSHGRKTDVYRIVPRGRPEGGILAPVGPDQPDLFGGRAAVLAEDE